MPRNANKLFQKIYQDLRSLAAQRLAGERVNHTLQPTALINEVFLRLNAIEKFENTGHFYTSAAQAMQRILIDHARARNSGKRGGKLNRIPLTDIQQAWDEPAELLVVDDLLSRLAKRSPRKAELVRLRVFAGCTIAESAEILGISKTTASDDWAFARAWLRREWLADENQEKIPK